MKDNLSTILERLWMPFDGHPVDRRPGRRIIDGGILHSRPRRFAGTVSGPDLLRSGDSEHFSAIALGRDLPSPAEMIRREQREKILEEAKKHPESIPTPGREGTRTKI